MLKSNISDNFTLFLDIIYGFCTGILFGAKHISVTFYCLSTLSYVIFIVIFFKATFKQIFFLLLTSIFAFILGRSFYNKKFYSRDIKDQHEKEINDLLDECFW